MSLISIILPTYNGEKFISKAIESCLEQSYRNFELIIVNDCSTDNTPSLINEFAKKDTRIRIIHNATNQRLPRSLNIGFTEARGDFFTWTSDDNYYAPDALEKLIDTLKKNDEVDIAYSSYRFINEHNRILETFGDEPEHLLFKCITGACFLYRKQVHIDLKGYAEDKFRMEDMDFWLRAATKFRYKFIDGKDLYFYRKHPESLTFEIYSNEKVYSEYRRNYAASYTSFFNTGLDANFTDRDLQMHIELFFEDLVQQKIRDFSVSEKLLAYIDHLDKLKELDWQKVNFRDHVVKQIIAHKKKRIVELIVNDIMLENKLLSNKNPKLASLGSKNISWYYKEYEVLPLWYKRLGHLVKVLNGNRPLKSLFKNNPTP